MFLKRVTVLDQVINRIMSHMTRAKHKLINVATPHFRRHSL